MLVAVITSRLESKRLPGKALLDICGKPLLQRVVDRVRQSNVDDVIVATTIKDDKIEAYCNDHGIKVFKGSEEDILDRVYNASKGYSHVLRVWGDSPLVNPDIINRVIDYYFDHLTSGYLYTIRYPQGQNVAMCDFATLENAHQTLKNPYDRHWIHKWFTEHGAKVFCDRDDLSHINYTVDTQEDLERICGILSTTSTGQSSALQSG